MKAQDVTKKAEVLKDSANSLDAKAKEAENILKGLLV